MNRGVVLVGMGALLTAVPAFADSPYANFANGPSTDPNFFPLAVWYQSPSNATKYKNIGINTYVVLDDDTTSDLAQLKAAGMYLIAGQDSFTLAQAQGTVYNKTITGWLQQDEPDNAQADGSGGYGPPVLPSTIVSIYNQWHTADPTRPVYLGLGQGVAHPYIGRGSAGNNDPTYAEKNYVPGSDIISYDIYPYASPYSDVHNMPWVVATGVDNLRSWAKPGQPVWNDIETTDISGYGGPTPIQTKTEVWMSLVHGSQGIVFFCHTWAAGPNHDQFDETGLLDNPNGMAAGVQALDNQITGTGGLIGAKKTVRLAPVLNSATVAGTIMGTPLATSSVEVDTMEKIYNGAWYLFAVQMRDGNTTALYKLTGLPASCQAVDVTDGRTLTVTNGQFSDTFTGYSGTPLHLYEITAVPEPAMLALVGVGLGAGLLRRRSRR